MNKAAPCLSLLCALLGMPFAHAASTPSTAYKSVTQYDCTPEGKPGLRLMIAERAPSKRVEYRIFATPSEVPLKSPMTFKANEFTKGLLMSCEENVCSQSAGTLTVTALKDGEYMEGDFGWTDQYTKKETAGHFRSRWDKTRPQCAQ